jgi:Natural resistance-associated macrophage protein
VQGQKQLVNQSLDTAESIAPERGWRFRRTNPSLPEVYRSVQVPKTSRGWLGFLRKLLAFSGPGYLVAVGYMDPGNWATDLAGSSQFYYTLLSVVIIFSLMAIFLQHLALKLGVVSRRDLASLPRPFSSGVQLYSLGRLRDRHRGLRLGGSDRIRNRPEFAFWATFGMGSVPNSLRRVGRPLPAK